MPAKSARLEVRLTEDAKQLLETAAALEGLPLSAFALTHLLKVAQGIVHERRTTTLSHADGLRLMERLESPPEPTPALRRAVKRWRLRRG